MRRASKYVIPWFKVWGNELLSSPKFQSLTDRETGALFRCWLLAYSNHAEVGWIPADIKVVSMMFGGSYRNHPARVKRILEILCAKRWLDKHIIDGAVRYELHHWETWQASKFDEFQDRNSSRVEQSSSRFPPVLLQSGGNNVANNDDALPESIEYRRVLLRNTPMPDGTGSLFEDDFEAGINDAKLPITQSKTKRKPKKPVLEAERILYSELLSYCENSYASDRKVSLSAISNASDYTALRGMVRRVLPAGFGLNTLQAAWARFLHSPDPWHRRQGHPLRYWASNLGSFLSDANQGQRETAGQRAEREIRAQAEALDRELHPDLGAKT